MADGQPGARSMAALGLLADAARAGHWPADPPLITGLAVDSREVRPGDLFAALPGAALHGGAFVGFAERMGAAAVLTDAAGLEAARAEGAALDRPILVSPDPRRALALAAARFFDAQPETVVAVTGTNGKTSVAAFTRQIWGALGLSAVNFGTMGVEGAFSRGLRHTTPEPVTLHRLLAELAEAGITHAAMEASSHGLDQRRLDGVQLSAAAFTNLSRDHLDYHPSLEAYFEAKCGLFDRVLPASGTAVVVTDDVNGGAGFGSRVVDRAKARGQRTLTVGRGGTLDPLASRPDATGQTLRFSHGGAARVVRLPLIGAFQASNVLVAAGLALATGAEPERVFDTLRGLRPVRGRMEKVAARGHGAPVFVDYSHTPASLQIALKALRPHVMGRLIVVFGAGGDRDAGKRPLMGQAAAAHADVVIVTDDNPRSEDPALIRRAVLAGCPEATEIGDRAHAILAGVDALEPGDALLIAGKGHETGQIIGDDVLPFDDAEQASVAVAALEGRGA